jgi:ORF6N domain-containing protein
MFDADLAMLYGVEVRSLNQAVARNRKRFSADFAFQLTDDELAALRSQLVISKSPASQASSRLRSQIVTSNTGRGGRRYLPYAFTEHGALQAANVLRSPRLPTLVGPKHSQTSIILKALWQFSAIGGCEILLRTFRRL